MAEGQDLVALADLAALIADLRPLSRRGVGVPLDDTVVLKDQSSLDLV